jgi:type II secretory pathway pseudopilin PulG
MRKHSEEGFTIVELMIAAAVMSTILVVSSVVMIGIGTLYYKGINQSQVQDNVRSINDEVAQHLELSDQFKTGSLLSGGVTVKSYCMGATRYSFAIGIQLGTIPHVLWRDIDNSGTCQPQDVTSTGLTGGTELIAPHSRLTNFTITQANPSDPYEITVGVAYGDDDLLCSASVAGSCITSTTMRAADFQNGDLLCKGLTGQQFCGTAKLSTTVVQRISGS